MNWTKEIAEQKLADMKMEDMPIIETIPKTQKLNSDWFKDYKIACKEFMLSLTDSIEELTFLNLNQDEFMGLISGKKMPNNLSIRFRIPILFGGEINPKNKVYVAVEESYIGEMMNENNILDILFTKVSENT